MDSSTAQGLAAGLEGFLKGQDWRQRREDDAYNMALKKRQEEMALKQYRAGLMKQGLQETEEGGFAPTEQALSDQEFERNYKMQMLQKQLGDQDLQRRLNEAQLKKLGAETAKTYKEANEEKKGKMLPAGEANFFGEAAAGMKDLENLSASIEKNKDLFGSWKAPLVSVAAALNLGDYGKRGATMASELKAVTQTIGTLLEKGKLTDADFPKYAGILAEIKNSPETAQEKIAYLKNKLAVLSQEKKKSLGQVGYDISGIEVPETASGLIQQKGLVPNAKAVANPEDNEAVQWAKQNLSGPNAEKAKKILQLNGVK